MDTATQLLAFKLQANSPSRSQAGSQAGSQGNKFRKGPSSVRSTASKNPFVKELAAQISEKDNPKAVLLMNRIEDMRMKIIMDRVVAMHEAILMPTNKVRYYDCIDPEDAKKHEQGFRTAVHQIMALKEKQNPENQKKTDLQRLQVIERFQIRMNMLIIAFRSLKKYYFQNDNYRISRSLYWENWEKSAFKLLDSPFVDSKIFIAKEIKKMSCQAILNLETRLPQLFDEKFLDQLIQIANGSELGDTQRYIIEALESMSLIKKYRDQLFPYYQKLIEYFKDGHIYNINISYFTKLLAKITLFQDVDYQALGIDDILLELFYDPIKDPKTAYSIIRQTNPDFINRYEGLQTKSVTPVDESVRDSKYSDYSEDMRSEVSDESSGQPLTGLAGIGKRIGLASRNTMRHQTSKSKLREQERGLQGKRLRLMDLRESIQALEQEKAEEVLCKLKTLDEADPVVIQQSAALGLSRLLIPSTDVTILENTSTERVVIYDKLLSDGHIRNFMNNEALGESNLLCQYLTTILANFLLQTKISTEHKGQLVIDQMLEAGLLPLVTQFCRNPNLSIKANAAWLFTAICINRLVNPFELTKSGIIRDIFVLYLDLHKFEIEDVTPNDSLTTEQDDSVIVATVETEQDAQEVEKRDVLDLEERAQMQIINQVLQLYNYNHFDKSIWKILNMQERIQHLIFSIFTYLSIYDDPNIVSAVHKVIDKDVDKGVEEIALCGLKELLELDREKMKLFIEILIQFTICDDLVFQENGIWYLKHIIINEELSTLLESQNVDILEVFIAGSICESSVIQQECVIVLTYLAIEKKAYRKHEDLLLDALMCLTTAPSSTVRGLAFNGLSSLALHGEYAYETLLKQANVPDYYNTISSNLRKFRNEFVQSHYNSETISQYSGINLLLGLSRSATQESQRTVCDRIPDILKMICAQNKILTEENINEVGSFLTIRALMCSQSIDIRENFVVPFIYDIARDTDFIRVDILIRPEFILWALNLLVESADYSKILRTSSLLRDVLYIFNTKLKFEQEETLIRELFTKILKKISWNPNEFLNKESHEKVSESLVLIFVRETNLQLAICDEVIEQVRVILEDYKLRSDSNHLALSKHLGSTIKFPQTMKVLQANIPHTIEVFTKMLQSSYEVIFNITRALAFLTKSIDFNAQALKAGYLKILCDKIEYLKPQDMHSLLKSIGNLLVYSRGQSGKNEFEWFYTSFYFEKLTNIVRDNQIHSLMETYCELTLKLMVEDTFCQKMFVDRLCYANAQFLLDDDLIQIIYNSITHPYDSTCDELSSEAFPFIVHSFKPNWMTLKTAAFALASQLLRGNQWVNLMREKQFGNLAVSCLMVTNDLLLAFQKKRPIDFYYEDLISKLCVFIQLEHISIPGEENPRNLMKQSKTLVSLAKIGKISKELQGRAVCILIHAVLNSPIIPDSHDLTNKLTPLFALITTSTHTEIVNLSIWGLKQLHIKYKNRNLPDFDFEEVIWHQKAIDHITPKLTDENKNIQENALLCLSQLLHHPEMKQEFVDFHALPSLMNIGQSSINDLLHRENVDMKILTSFAQVLASLINGRVDMQDYLIKEYQVLDLIFNTCNLVRQGSTDEMIIATDAFSKVLSNLVENTNVHKEILAYKIDNDFALTMINKMFHDKPNPAYTQLKIDNNVAKVYHHMVEKSTSLLYGNMKFFARFLKQLCSMYDQIEYLSQTETDTHMTCLKTLNLLAAFRKQQINVVSEDDLEDLLQELKKGGLLEPLLMFELSSVPEIREVATATIFALTNI